MTAPVKKRYFSFNEFTDIHGINCPKVDYSSEYGYLHYETDDTLYSVNGSTYCGRCHNYISERKN
jgi:hypothetical protein